MAYKWGLYNNRKELVISIRKRLNRIYNYNKGSRKLQLINKLIVLMKWNKNVFKKEILYKNKINKIINNKNYRFYNKLNLLMKWNKNVFKKEILYKNRINKIINNKNYRIYN